MFFDAFLMHPLGMGTLIGALYMLYMKHKSGMRKWLSDWKSYMLYMKHKSGMRRWFYMSIVYAVYET